MRVSGLTKTFGRFTAVDCVDMNIPKQTVYGFIGPNGSGKTTAIRMMCGLLQPTAGEIEVLGMKIPEQTEQIRRQVGYMTQKFSLYSDLSVRQNMQFMAKIMGVGRRERKKRMLDLLEKFKLSSFIDRRAGDLSGGQKRRLALATAVIHQPRLLLLDEPTSEVDPNTRRDFWDELFVMCEAGTTILVTTHLMDEAERCHNLAIINEGRKVADGSPAELKKVLGGRLLSVKGPDVRTIRKLLAESPEVLAITQIGISLRIILAEDVADGPAKLANSLAAIGDKKIETVTPSIEDVFVMMTRENGANHG
ncbi:ABC transporter ATP-binding protein [Desulfopila sp. IMCC35008]|uniref:ABC transporter ATP-binding protein n=1 Tax=Desulfopila sp. IMCC35008 TaxID=2653858 RepID=UPI0013D8593B